MDVRAILSVKSFYLNVSLLEEKSQCTYAHKYVPVTQNNQLHKLTNTNVNNTVHVSKGLSIALSSTPGLFVLFAFSKGKEVKEETLSSNFYGLKQQFHYVLSGLRSSS